LVLTAITMKTVRIIDCGRPPGGWQREFGVVGPQGLFLKTQGFVTSNTHDAARREAQRHGLDHYIDEAGRSIPVAPIDTL
jgi:hypothetical protein